MHQPPQSSLVCTYDAGRKYSTPEVIIELPGHVFPSDRSSDFWTADSETSRSCWTTAGWGPAACDTMPWNNDQTSSHLSKQTIDMHKTIDMHRLKTQHTKCRQALPAKELTSIVLQSSCFASFNQWKWKPINASQSISSAHFTIPVTHRIHQKRSPFVATVEVIPDIWGQLHFTKSYDHKHCDQLLQKSNEIYSD